MTRFSLHARPGLRTTVWSQVKVCERRLCLRPIGYTPASSVIQKRRCRCGIRLVRKIYPSISQFLQLIPSIGGKTRLHTSCNWFRTLHGVWSLQQRNHVTYLVEHLACIHVGQWRTRCHMLNVTDSQVLVSQKVRRNRSFYSEHISQSVRISQKNVLWHGFVCWKLQTDIGSPQKWPMLCRVGR